MFTNQFTRFNRCTGRYGTVPLPQTGSYSPVQYPLFPCLSHDLQIMTFPSKWPTHLADVTVILPRLIHDYFSRNATVKIPDPINCTRKPWFCSCCGCLRPGLLSLHSICYNIYLLRVAALSPSQTCRTSRHFFIHFTLSHSRPPQYPRHCNYRQHGNVFASPLFCRLRFFYKWEEVGELLHDTCVRVGALNCTKHRDLCRSLKVTHFPSLLALNWSGAPIVEPGSRAATKPIPRVPGAGDIVAGIQNIFSAEINEDNLETGELPSASKTEGAESAADSAGGRMGDVGATCRLRMEDAVASIRWFLKDEVFINAENSLDKERLGERDT